MYLTQVVLQLRKCCYILDLNSSFHGVLFTRHVWITLLAMPTCKECNGLRGSCCFTKTLDCSRPLLRHIVLVVNQRDRVIRKHNPSDSNLFFTTLFQVGICMLERITNHSFSLLVMYRGIPFRSKRFSWQVSSATWDKVSFRAPVVRKFSYLTTIYCIK